MITDNVSTRPAMKARNDQIDNTIPAAASQSTRRAPASESRQALNSTLSPAAKPASTVRDSAESGRRAAAADRESGTGLREGLGAFLRSRAGQAAADFLLDIVSERIRERSGETPTKEAAENAGARARSELLQQSEKQALQYLKDRYGPSFAGTTAGEVLDYYLQTKSAASSGAAAASAPSTSTSTASAGSTLSGGIGAAYSAYDLISNYGRSTPERGAANGAAIGAYIGTYFSPGIGTVIGMAIGAVAGGVIGAIHGGKHKDQMLRDALRGELQKGGVIDEKFQLTLADGSKYDIGKDGGARYQNTDGTQRAAYDVDFSNPLSAELVGWTQPLAALLTGGNKKLKDDLTGYLVNAASSNASTLDEARLNALQFFAGAGMTREHSQEALAELAAGGRISNDEAAAYSNGINSLFIGTEWDDSRLTEVSLSEAA